MNLLKKATTVICSIQEHSEVDQKIIHLCLDSKCQISKKALCGLYVLAMSIMVINQSIDLIWTLQLRMNGIVKSSNTIRKTKS
ncbi:unnamed protein product [Paramecium octaurelia]|uniref:Uncharacterized protein n=1 Tax=Paramecium octaurelia TaxID=43137 RepID=A0A8S1SAQ0_PAROT|nr:unnamed protein product [Paramecium octaurelia]